MLIRCVLCTEVVWTDYEGEVFRESCLHCRNNFQCQNVVRPLCEEKAWGSASGTEEKLKVRVTDLLKLCSV